MSNATITSKEFLLSLSTGASTIQYVAFSTGSRVNEFGKKVISYAAPININAIILPIRANDVLLEPGFVEDDYRKLYLDPTQVVNQQDVFIFSNKKWFAQAVQDIQINSNIIYKKVFIRKLVGEVD